MNPQLEQELRRALAIRAAELPPDASAKLLAGNYRPRVSRRRAPLALATFAVASGAVLAILLMGLSTSPPRAFAGWSPAPRAVPGQSRRADAVCRSMLKIAAGRDRQREPGSGNQDRPATPFPTSGWQMVLVDTRGPYTTVVSEVDHGRAVSTCFVDRRGEASAGSAIGVRPPAAVPAEEVAFASSGSTTTPPDEGSRQFSMVVGRTGAGVTGVRLRLNDGTRVTASSANGWFLAWWPGSHGLSATEVTTARGTRDQ